MLSGKRVSVVLWTCSLLLVVGNLPAAGKKTTKTDPGQSAVENAQRAEVAGAVDRRERLAGALRELPESSLVRWQAGFVRDGKTWRSFDEIPAAPPNSAVKSAYAARRREAAATLAGQMDLANWCRKQGLADQDSRAGTRSTIRSSARSSAGDQSSKNWRNNWTELRANVMPPQDRFHN
ncbi:MAG: hypothetical protein HY290_21295 [Planctomycetia bacterium]|nr:hypothetical protein [Planctomycetia bacterium]